MLLSHYLPKIITALFGGLFISLGIYTFGNGLLFDRIFLGVLIFTGVICRKNVNVLGVVAIVLCIRMVEELAWIVIESEISAIVRLCFYSISVLTYFRLRYDPLSRLFFVAISLCLISEAFWFLNDRKSPDLHWYLLMMALAMFTRHLIFSRVSYTEDYFPKKAASINLDFHIFKLNALTCLIELINIFEYVIRNVLGYVEIVYFYYLYPYLMQAISTYLIWRVFHESYRLLLPKLLRA